MKKETYQPRVGDIVKRSSFGCREKLGVVLEVGKRKMNYTTFTMFEPACLVSYDGKKPVWDATYFLEKMNA